MKKRGKKKKGWLIWIVILVVVIGIVYLFNKSPSKNFGTDPEEIFNYTSGEFSINPYEPISFEKFYEEVQPPEGPSLLEKYSELKTNFTFHAPKLDFNYNTYNYEMKPYDACIGKRIKIDFENPRYSDFQFNYKNQTFKYKINLYQNMYSFSDSLKNQNCYFDTNKYIPGFLEDPYNNYFIDAVSRDFISLKDKGYSNDEIVEVATLFVQSITYGTDYTGYNRYPYETLFEKEGNCLDKSLILVGILRNLGYTSYIISGDSNGQRHALVGIVCNKGNINYENQEICFIETTIFSPISSEAEIDIDGYLKTSNGTLIYSGANYGSGLITFFDIEDTVAKGIEDKMDSVESNLIEIEGEMCRTDCVRCGTGMFGAEFVDWEASMGIRRCHRADTFNSLGKEYNNNIDEYNSLLKEWYRQSYSMEKAMFNNINLIERQENYLQ